MTTEKNIKPEKKDEKGKERGEKTEGGLRKVVDKLYSPMAATIAVASVAATLAISSCMSSETKKTDADADSAEATEVVDEDASNDALEDVVGDISEDAVLDVPAEVADANDGPVRLDSIDEDSRPDTVEDTAGDPVEEDVPVDTSTDTGSDVLTDTGSDEVVSETCGPVAEIRTVFVSTGATTTVGNVTVGYVGPAGSDGRYTISCGTVIETVDIPRGSACLPVDVGGGYFVEITANVVGPYGSNITVDVSASP